MNSTLLWAEGVWTLLEDSEYLGHTEVCVWPDITAFTKVGNSYIIKINKPPGYDQIQASSSNEKNKNINVLWDMDTNSLLSSSPFGLVCLFFARGYWHFFFGCSSKSSPPRGVRTSSASSFVEQTGSESSSCVFTSRCRYRVRCQRVCLS